MEVQEIITEFLKKDIIIEKEVLDLIKDKKISIEDIQALKLTNGQVLTKKHLDLEKEAVVTKPKSNLAKDYESLVKFEKWDFDTKKEIDIRSLMNLFNFRYNKIKNILLNRLELKNAVSIGRLNEKSSDKDVSVIGMVSDIRKTKAGNTIIELEDPTGKINAFVSSSKDIDADKVLNDEIIGIKGNKSKDYLFINSIIWPDIPIPTQINKIKDPLEAVFIADLHYGSNEFIKDIEEKFLKWIRTAKKVKYLFIAGDLVDGCGVYPQQDQDLTVKDIHAQYKLFEEFIEKIPEHIEIIICPGNHDAIRQAEPQPPFGKDLLPNIHDLKNVHLVPNPSYVNIHARDGQGITVLMYHGYSFTSLIDKVPYLRRKGTTQPQHVMVDVLKRRHLAPLYGSTIISHEEKDYLVIDRVPDIFQTADLHSHSVSNYKGTTLISSSSFQGQTAFMDRVGHIANPGKITIVDLQTRNVEVKDFYQ